MTFATVFQLYKFHCTVFQWLNLIRIKASFFLRTPPHVSWKWLWAQFIIWLGWGESRKRPSLLVVEMGIFFPLPHQFVSLFCSVSSRHTKTEFSKSSLLSGSFFSTACSHPPFSPSWTDMLEETYATIPTSWQPALLEWDLAQGGSSCLEREEGLGKETNLSEL